MNPVFPRRRGRARLIAAVLLTAAGCVPPASGELGDPTPRGAAVRVVFSPRRDVHHAWRPAGDSAVVRDVRQIIGRVRDASHDTAFVAVTTVYQGAIGNVSLVPQGTLLAVVVDSTARVEVINLHPRGTERGIAFAIAGWLSLLTIAAAGLYGTYR